MGTNYYISVQGGTGLNFGLASFLSASKAEHPEDKYYVTSPYFDIFEVCPAVDDVYKPQEMSSFIFDAVADENSKIINTRLYDLDGFIKKQMNYSQAWAYLMGYEWNDTENGTKVKSILNPYSKFPQLKQNVDAILKAVKDNGFDDYAIMQFTGGQSPLVQVPQGPDGQGDWSKVPYNYQDEALKRHYPIEKVNEFVELYHKAHPKTAILLYQLPNEPAPDANYVIKTVMPYLAWYELAKGAKEIVAIDSSLQHLTAGLCPATIIWAHTEPNNFGYSYNNNVIQKCRRNDIILFGALGPSGNKVEYIEPKDLLLKTNNLRKPNESEGK